MSRPRQVDRQALITDLLNLDTPLEEIVVKYRVTPRSLYFIANQEGFDMYLRRRLIKMRAEKKALDKRIKDGIRNLRKSVGKVT